VVRPVVALRDGSQQPYVPPDKCPVSGERVVEEEGEVAVCCVNATCPAQVVRRIEHWVSRGAMDIESFGERLSQDLVEKGLLEDVADLYSLRVEDLLPLEGFAEKRATNLVQAISASKERPLWRVLVGLGIRGVGSQVAQVLTAHYHSIDALMQATPEELQEIESIGPVLARSVTEFFGRERHRQLIEKLRRHGVSLADEEPESERGPTPLQGLTFVITGTLPSMSRDAATKLIEQHGGRVTGSVSGNTDYLLVGENPGGTKYDKAQSLGTPMISEDDLMEMIAKGSPTPHPQD